MNSDKNDKPSVSSFKQGARGVDHEDNPMQIPERRKSWTETIREAIGFPAASTTAQKPPQKPHLTQEARDKLDNALDDAKHAMDSTDTGASMRRRGSDILDEVAKEAARRDIGGNQLFGSPKGTGREGSAGNAFLTKYANESAPGENTS
ncbi:hypothetical protein TWF696_000630 [Orbilia brochopaga]|uniref:Uncharacterized protein n=1 Tax=Orbilia brochopaga TaxID=3140254 RepID=A0AAV9VEK5_9PEZI